MLDDTQLRKMNSNRLKSYFSRKNFRESEDDKTEDKDEENIRGGCFEPNESKVAETKKIIPDGQASETGIEPTSDVSETIRNVRQARRSLQERHRRDIDDLRSRIGNIYGNEIISFLTEDDKITTTEFFANPLEYFLAKVNQHLVTCNLIENNEEIGYLVYLVELEGMYNVVYVFNGRSDFQRRRIGTTYREVPGDLRIVPVDGGMSRTPSSRRLQLDWSILVFSTYFGLPYFPEGDYFS